jgi:hypothetical protein
MVGEWKTAARRASVASFLGRENAPAVKDRPARILQWFWKHDR